MSSRPRSPGRRRIDLAVLALLGAGIVGLDAWLGAHLRAGVDRGTVLGVVGSIVLYVLAGVWVIRRRPSSRQALVVVFAIALAARLVLVGHAPVLSSDVYRYVWDGRIQSHWVNPYLHPPNDPTLARYRDAEIYPRINRAHVPTAYPPVAEVAFAAVYALHPDSVTWTKLAFVFIDLAAIGLLAALLARVRMRPERALLYAWHPLTIVEVAHSGHVEVLVVVLVLGALHAAVSSRRALAGVGLALAALVKPYALLATPALLASQRPRATWRTLAAVGATLALAYLPFATAGTRVLGYLPAYLQEEGFVNGNRFHLVDELQRLTGPLPHVAFVAYSALIAMTMAALGLWCWRSRLGDPGQVARRALVLFLVALVMVTPNYPWYWLLAAALLPLAQGPLLAIAVAMTASAPMLYLHSRTPTRPWWPLTTFYVGSAVVLAALALWWLTRALIRRRRAARDDCLHTHGQDATPVATLPPTVDAAS